MLKFSINLLLLSLSLFVTAFAGNNGVCQKCIIIREENAKKHNPYDYYEDYLEAKENGDLEGDAGFCAYSFEEEKEGE